MQACNFDSVQHRRGRPTGIRSPVLGRQPVPPAPPALPAPPAAVSKGLEKRIKTNAEVLYERCVLTEPSLPSHPRSIGSSIWP